MEIAKRYLRGELHHHELRRHLAIMSLTFWSLIFTCFLLFPKDHHFSIMTHTFSFLGSFAEYHNPEWWWFFTLAMVFWGLSLIPVVIYIHRRFTLISPIGARIAATLLMIGCVGIIGVGFFPDAHGKVIGDWEWTHLHMKAAFTITAGFLFGIIAHGILLLKDRFSGKPSVFDHGKIKWAYLFWGSIFSVAMYFQIKWGFVYAERKAAAKAAGEPFGSAWSEAMNTIYSFPLWENIVIYTLFIFIVWFTLLLPKEPYPAPTKKVR
jgi:hypothetical protein